MWESSHRRAQRGLRGSAAQQVQVKKVILIQARCINFSYKATSCTFESPGILWWCDWWWSEKLQKNSFSQKYDSPLKVKCLAEMCQSEQVCQKNSPVLCLFSSSLIQPAAEMFHEGLITAQISSAFKLQTGISASKDCCTSFMLRKFVFISSEKSLLDRIISLAATVFRAPGDGLLVTLQATIQNEVQRTLCFHPSGWLLAKQGLPHVALAMWPLKLGEPITLKV